MWSLPMLALAAAAEQRIVAPNPEIKGWQELFDTDAGRQDLEQAVRMGGITGFKFMINCVTGLFPYCAESNWAQVASTLQRLGVRIGIEAGMFQGVEPGAQLPNACDGTQDALDDLAKIKPLLDAGATIGWWAMDSVFQHTYPYSDASQVWQHQNRADCCGFSVEQAIAEGVKYAQAIQNALPGVEIGMNEPAPWYWVTGDFPPSNVNLPDYAMHDRDLAQIVPAFRSALRSGGVNLAFFHTDMPYEFSTGQATLDKGSNGWLKLARLGQVAAAAGLRYGKYFNTGLPGDDVFYQLSLKDAQNLRASAGTLPEDMILESWFQYPTAMLPLNQQYSFLWDAVNFFTSLNAVQANSSSVQAPPAVMV